MVAELHVLNFQRAEETILDERLEKRATGKNVFDFKQSHIN